MATHTPGPWTHRPNRRGAEGCEIRGAADEMIADVYDAGDGSHRVANACVMAAAPELLDALIVAKGTLEIACGTTAPYIKVALTIIDAAIAKAEGRLKS